MDVNNLTNVYNQNPTLQGSYTLPEYLALFGGNSTTPTPTPTTPTPAPSQGIINANINQYQNQGGGGGGPSVVDSTSVSEYRNPNASAYGPGGQLEVNPAAIGMDFTSQGNAKSQGGLFNMFSTPPRSMANFTAAGTGPSELGYMTKDIEGLPGVNRDMIRGEYDNYSTFLGRSSNYPDARVKGKTSDLVNMIPYVGSITRGAKMLGLSNDGPTSDRSKYATDNGFAGGQGLGRDEFGVYTGGKTALGKTADYQERIGNRLGELESFFSKKGIDLDDPNLDVEKMKGINGFYTKQYFAYKNRQATNKINQDYNRKVAEEKAAAEKAEKDRKVAEQQALNNAYVTQTKTQREAGGGGGGQFDGAASKASYDKDPTSYSGSFKKGGRVEYNEGGSTNGSSKAALSAKVKELMDDGYEFGEAVKEAMKQGYMNGGRIKSYFKGGLVSLRGR